MKQMNSKPFSWAFTAIRSATPSTTVRRLRSATSSSSLPGFYFREIENVIEDCKQRLGAVAKKFPRAFAGAK